MANKCRSFSYRYIAQYSLTESSLYGRQMANKCRSFSYRYIAQYSLTDCSLYCRQGQILFLQVYYTVLTDKLLPVPQTDG